MVPQTMFELLAQCSANDALVKVITAEGDSDMGDVIGKVIWANSKLTCLCVYKRNRAIWGPTPQLCYVDIMSITRLYTLPDAVTSDDQMRAPLEGIIVPQPPDN
jgi:fructose-specific component phosphotransferase system IIB-like protein